MVTHEEGKCIVNIRLLKIARMYEIFDPGAVKVYRGRSACQLVIVAFLFVNAAATAAMGWSVYRCLDDYYSAVHYSMMTVVLVYNLCKTYYLVSNADAIWGCMDLTSVDFLRSYGRYRGDVLRSGRAGCLRFTNFFAALWGGTCVFWMISPLLISTEYADSAAAYRLNVFNILFPVSVRFYNDNFPLFYAAECTLMAYNSYVLILFDVVIVPFFMACSIQLRTIGMAYESIGYRQPFSHFQDTGNTSTANEPNHPIKNLKLIIQDHQRVIEKMRDIYKIFGPVVLIMIAVESNILVFQSFTLIAGLMEGLSFRSPVMLKLFIALFVYIFHLFTVCFLLTKINKQKSYMNFALYSSNWTELGMDFKKLICLTMQMNNAEKLVLKISAKKIVNLEMFASVMHMCYSIISVMVKSKQKSAD